MFEDENTESLQSNELQGDDENLQDGTDSENGAGDGNAADADAAGDDGKGKTDDVYGSPENFDYSEIKMPENMILDEELVAKFNPIAKELNLSNKSANRLMNLAVELAQKNSAKTADLVAEIQQAEINSYGQLLNTDSELSAMKDDEYSQYLSIANKGIDAVATDGFKNILKQKGLTHHPEFIKTFHAIGKLCQNDTIPDAKNPVGMNQRAADILYGSKD